MQPSSTEWHLPVQVASWISTQTNLSILAASIISSDPSKVQRVHLSALAVKQASDSQLWVAICPGVHKEEMTCALHILSNKERLRSWQECTLPPPHRQLLLDQESRSILRTIKEHLPIGRHLPVLALLNKNTFGMNFGFKCQTSMLATKWQPGR